MPTINIKIDDDKKPKENISRLQEEIRKNGSKALSSDLKGIREAIRVNRPETVNLSPLMRKLDSLERKLSSLPDSIFDRMRRIESKLDDNSNDDGDDVDVERILNKNTNKILNAIQDSVSNKKEDSGDMDKVLKKLNKMSLPSIVYIKSNANQKQIVPYPV